MTRDTRAAFAPLPPAPWHGRGVNGLGESVLVGQVERAIAEACRRGHAEVAEFTVAPCYPSADAPRGGHEWLVEFADPARAPGVFVRVLDETLQALNTNYRARRTGDGGMRAPRVLELPPGTFHRWLRQRRTPGDRCEVPRVANDRTVADGVLFVVAVWRQEPLIVS